MDARVHAGPPDAKGWLTPLIGRPMLPLLAGLMAGIAAAPVCAGTGSPNNGVFLCVCLAVLIPVIRADRRHLPGICLLLVMGFALMVRVETASVPAGVSRFAADSPCTITGTIATRPLAAGDRWRFLLDVSSLGDGEAFQLIDDVRIRVTVDGGPLTPVIGDQLRFSGKLKPVRNFEVPGGFDYAGFMRRKGVFFTTYTTAEAVYREPGNSLLSRAYHQPLARLRNRFSRVLDQAGVTGQVKGMLEAWTLGDRSGIPPALSDAFARTGLGHILAISGFHVGAVALVLFGGFRWICRRIRGVTSRGLADKTAALAALSGVLVYGCVAGMSDATQRAVIMAGVFLFGLIIGRDADAVNSLAAAALLILLLDPPAVFAVSFQLSFAAVAMILLVLHQPVFRHPSITSLPAWVRVCFQYVCIATAATLGTAPLLLHYFYRIAVWSIPVNTLAAPLFGLFVLPFSLMLLPLSWVFPAGAILAARGLNPVVDALGNSLLYLGSRDGVSVLFFPPDGLELAVIYSLILLLVCLPGTWGDQTRRRQAVAGLGLVLLLLCGKIGWTVWQRMHPGTLSVTALDVRQGTAVLVRFPDGKTLLADGGGYYDNRVFDVGKHVVGPYLMRQRIRTLDRVVLTHPDGDHVNGLVHILEQFCVKSVWWNGDTSRCTGFRQFMNAVTERHVPLRQVSTGTEGISWGGVQMRVLHPAEPAVLSGKDGKNRNNRSIVLQLGLGDSGFLITGDILRAAEKELAGRWGKQLKSQVLIVPHHGSRTSSTPGFLDQVCPEVAVASVGAGNRFHLPSPEVVERYAHRGIPLLRTDQDGTVRFVTDGNQLAVHRCQGLKFRLVKSVDLQVPAD
ncbi:MAG: DNA internalization-related competence protein ComEC/Rec2 [Deltaproteobacteria bacterium]|nr:MAG: DNA internalization-related competence protein ComEC/Rec2 [Deltaproteobacteria bacterium]